MTRPLATTVLMDGFVGERGNVAIGGPDGDGGAVAMGGGGGGRGGDGRRGLKLAGSMMVVLSMRSSRAAATANAFRSEGTIINVGDVTLSFRAEAARELMSFIMMVAAVLTRLGCSA